MRNSDGDEEPLHLRASISQAMEHQRRAMRDEINGLREDQVTAQPESLSALIASRFSINIPVLDDAAIHPNRRDVDIDVSHDPTRLAFHLGRPAVAKGTEITISVPFQGDAEIFRLHASSHTMEYPRGRIGEGAVTFTRRAPNFSAAEVRREFDRWLAAIKGHLDGMRKELGNFNESLKAEARATIQARIDKFKRDDDLLGGLGFGIPKRSP